MFVIQIGAEDGKIDSHRGLDEVYDGVMNKDWKAIIFEPNPRHFDALCNTYRGCANVKLRKAAIANITGPVTFYDCEMDGASTLIERVLARNNYHNGKSKNYKEITVCGIEINHMLKYYNLPDYLVIDTEGFDGTIIEMLDLGKYPIPKIRFEFAHIEHGDKQQAQLGRVCLKLLKYGYTLTHDKADIVAELC